MGDLSSQISANLGLVTLVFGIAVVLLTAAVILQARAMRRLGRRLDALTRGASGNDLEEVLDHHLQTVFRVAHDIDELAVRTSDLERDSRHALQRLGLVRFNPFEDTGGNQSFALAVLDADDHGFVVSSLHARSGTRMYAKALAGGRAESVLSTEEEDALRLARSSVQGRIAVDERRGTAPSRAR